MPLGPRHLADEGLKGLEAELPGAVAGHGGGEGLGWAAQGLAAPRGQDPVAGLEAQRGAPAVGLA